MQRAIVGGEIVYARLAARAPAAITKNVAITKFLSRKFIFMGFPAISRKFGAIRYQEYITRGKRVSYYVLACLNALWRVLRSMWLAHLGLM